jgi:cytochrome c553
MAGSRALIFGTILFSLLSMRAAAAGAAQAADGDDQFERQVRPLLIERCHKCHSAKESKGGLRLDSRAAVLKGGESGAAIVVNKPDESLLIQAVRHQSGLQMPPDGKLTNAQVEALAKWIRDGAAWPDTATTATPDNTAPDSGAMARQPNSGELASALQLWLRADALQLADGESVPVWPDQSGHGRDLSATKGVREGGVGGPGNFARQSTLVGRPAVRFTQGTGLASSPGNPVDIRGDAALTVTIVMNLAQFEGQPSHSSVFCVGNPANSGDPGKPLAALIEIDQPQQFSLDFAGGWGHDAVLAPGSYQPLFGKPVILTIVKRPGPMKDTTRFYINGKLAGPTDDRPLTGRDTVPDIQHRSDIGVFLGKALSWCGAFQGDIGEVLLYNSALADADRLGIEIYLGEKFGLWIDEERSLAAKAVYTEAEKSHWAYQPVRNVAPPAVENEAWIRTPVDRFALAAFAASAIMPSPEVDKLTLIRRATFDLTGLPPTPEEVDAFLADTSPQAYETVVHRLLESPHYGERWGRHWLDLVRYAESTANDANAVTRYACRYRNYVIEAFNSDLPYDQFLIEQLAGDLLPPSESVAVNSRRIIATGYLMVGPKALAETDKEQSRLDIVDDQIDVTGRAMLGLTVACARCHDHKFDAIRTTDYYALAGVFRSTEPFQNEVRNATMWWEFPIPQGAGVEPLMVMAPKESQPRNLRVHLRGNRFTLGKVVPRNVLGIVAAASPSPEDDSQSMIDPHQFSSGRLELARWIASSSNPLTARVLVNRVWQLHFGRGIVATPDNFGTRGELPSHPELLDWLATQFMEGGWSIKRLHRLIVLSNTYRMRNASAAPASGPSSLAALRVQRRRLSAEELRDAMLAVSGQLDRTPGGNESGEFLHSKAEDINAMIRPNRVGADDEFYTSFRKRSVYLPIVRNMLPDVLALFDAADPNGVTAVRNETTVASQGLFLLNHPLVRGQSRTFAERIMAGAALPDERRIELAHRLAYGRSATPIEQDDTQAFLLSFMQSSALAGKPEQEQRLAAWQAFCQSLLCSNEFLYLE